MQELRLELTAVRDLKPTMKNLNMIFIVLEIGNIYMHAYIYFCFLRICVMKSIYVLFCIQVDQM